MRKLYFFLKSQLSFRHALRSMLPSSTHSALGSMDITDHFKDDTSSGVENPTVMVRPSKSTSSKAVTGRYILSCPSETFIGFKLRYRTRRDGIQTGRQAALFSDKDSSLFVKKQTHVASLSLAQFQMRRPAHQTRHPTYRGILPARRTPLYEESSSAWSKTSSHGRPSCCCKNTDRIAEVHPVHR